jgi:hypothetical protein
MGYSGTILFSGHHTGRIEPYSELNINDITCMRFGRVDRAVSNCLQWRVLISTELKLANCATSFLVNIEKRNA